MASAPSGARAAADLLAGSVDTVLEAMLRHPMVSSASLTVTQAHDLFGDDHLHSLLVLGDGDQLLAVVERADLLTAADPFVAARHVGRLDGRTVRPDADLETTRLDLVRARRRRSAVVARDGRLLGLLCLKRTGLGFCSDADVAARAAEHTRDRPSIGVPPVGLEPTLRPF